jgi:Ca-activated chloride channel homolog
MRLFRFLFFAIIPIPFVLGQGGQPKARERVYVIAVKTTGDASIFRRCPSAGSGSREGAISYQLAPFRAPELFSSSREVVPEGVSDAAITARIESEFRRQKKYDVVASLDEADLVFFVEAHFSSWIEMSAPGRPAPPDMSGRGTSPAGSAGSSYIFAGQPDEKPNVLDRALAIATTPESYRRDAEDGAALLKSAVWLGMATGINDRSTKPEGLVSEFQRRQKSAANMQICAASQPRHALPGGNPETPNATKADSTRPVVPNRASAAASASVFRVEVDLVTVPVIVTDANGRHTPDIAASDFHIFEDNVEQKIDRMIPETEPFNVALLLDTSHSTQNNFDEIRRAALVFVQSLRTVDQVMVLSFNDRVYVDAELTGDRDKLIQALSQVRSGPDTRLYDAVSLAFSERLRSIPGRKAMVLFTDGVDTVSGLADEKSTVAQVEEADTPVYVIHYDTQAMSLYTPPIGMTGKFPDGFRNRDQVYAQGAAYLHLLADGSGGTLTRAESASAVRTAFLQVAQELTNQYTICYYPANKARDGSLRRIRVIVDRPDLKVRARSGYRESRNPASR